MPTATTPDERQLRAKLRGYRRRREAHERAQADLDAELAGFVAEARGLWGDYGSVTRVAELAGVSRATVHRSLARQ